MNEPVQTTEAPVKPKAGRTSRAEPGRTNDPERTRADILEVATREFAEKGLAGARVDLIAEATRTSKRMIYYYFESKEGLYLAVLEREYQRIREAEAKLHLDDLRPEDALRKLVASTVDYHLGHPDFSRLVMTENIHRGEYLARSEVIQRLNVPAIDAVAAVYKRGLKAGVFRSGVDPVDLHMSISALALFNVTNKHTFSLIFKRELDSAAAIVARRDSIVEMVVRYVRK
jgi:AcrR family transcriptional regulator